MRLLVEARAQGQAGANLPAAIAPASLDPEHQKATSILLELAGGSDCILQTRLDPSVPPGVLLTDVAQQHNLRLIPKEHYTFSVFSPPSGDGFDLVELEAEVLLLDNTSYSHTAATTTTTGDVGCGSSNNQRSTEADVVQVDAQELTRAFCKSCHGRVLAVNEHVVLAHQGHLLLVRVTAVHSATEEEREEMIRYHCYRGRLTPDTQVYLRPAWEEVQAQEECNTSSSSTSSSSTSSSSTSSRSKSTAVANGHHPSTNNLMQQQLSELSIGNNQQQPQQSQQQQHQKSGTSDAGTATATAAAAAAVPSRMAALAGAAAGSSSQASQPLQLVNVLTKSDRPPATNVVHVYTNDGEWFPVRKKLLRPCIALTQVVRDAGDTAPSVTVDIDTLTFDRVLIFLEALALGQEEEELPEFPLKYLEDMAKAAATLGLRSLSQHCEQLSGSRTAAMARYSPAQVAQAIAEGAVWLLLDGMVLDVGAWLPEHPGGTAIIPRQAMNNDCSRFFEMYHASRESFLYLKEFYIGELYPHAAAAEVPLGGGQPPSPEFMAQLREYTQFRRDPEQLPDSSISVAFKSF